MYVCLAVFLTDELLDWLIGELGVTWYKALVLMGMSFSEVEASLPSAHNLSVAKRQVKLKY